ncbi:PREDICTED: early nodulin-like protein 2 [Priapulus caudatus]|uniref:Early nodulin-like protein 2 n=1 Tax=Priapulus caudatus TaxID=37621 RepID=A0ABM1DWM0_PRICU|nr:PREDICTED: early nodulin-like protein 2 [Priapulus caudatus]
MRPPSPGDAGQTAGAMCFRRLVSGRPSVLAEDQGWKEWNRLHYNTIEQNWFKDFNTVESIHIQLTFNQPHVITGVATQGVATCGSSSSSCSVENFTLLYEDGPSGTYVTAGTFEAVVSRLDVTTPRVNMLQPHITTAKLKFMVKSFVTFPVLKVEVLGCSVAEHEAMPAKLNHCYLDDVNSESFTDIGGISAHVHHCESACKKHSFYAKDPSVPNKCWCVRGPFGTYGQVEPDNDSCCVSPFNNGNITGRFIYVAGQGTPPELNAECAEHVTTYPATTHPATTQPTRTLPAPTQPATTQPATTQPATTQPATTQPATTQPATTQPATTQPGTTQPATTQPGTTQPATTQPATTQPTTTQPATTQPGTTQPGTTQPATTQPARTTTAKPKIPRNV